MNRGPRTGAVAKKWLSRAEDKLKRTGYYEDDTVMIVEMNYTDMPKSWFIASGLEHERLDDLPHVHADGGGGVLRRAGAFGELTHLDLEAEGTGGVGDSLRVG